MFPDDMVNWTPSMAAVTLQYPPTYIAWLYPGDVVSWLLTTEVKCFTNVVLLGLNKCKVPDAESLPVLPILVVKCWASEDWASSLEAK